MTTYRVPLNAGDNDITFEMPVRGALYAFTVRHNSRENKWYMDVMSAVDRSPLRMGIKLVVNFPLLFSYMGADCPNGEFNVLDSENKGQDPEDEDVMGARWDLFFQEFTRAFP